MRPAQKAQPLVFARRYAHRGGIVTGGDAGHQFHEMPALLLRAIDLHDEQCIDVAGIADAEEILGRMDGRAVHHFHAGRNDAVRDDIGDALCRGLDRRKSEQHGLRRLRLDEQPQRHLRDHAEQAFRADGESQQVIARRIERLAAEFDHFPAHQYDLQAEHVVRRHAVLQAMHAAGILGDVAADGAGDLTGWIRCVVKAARGDRLRYREVGHAGLHDRRAIVVVDVEDLLSRLRPSRMPSSSGRAPPESDVPAPRGTTLTWCSLHHRRMADICAVFSRQHDQQAVFVHMRSGRRTRTPPVRRDDRSRPHRGRCAHRAQDVCPVREGA